ncbi:hypothetical protein MHH81_20925 [Psychrobacillus sp. FSL H8-0484]|uniref:hypothetical protein n=1 Tax=Psychrobacillus sp. FSL H8-0484 TaxID=2921390 RepID=UPI0030FBCDE1
MKLEKVPGNPQEKTSKSTIFILTHPNPRRKDEKRWSFKNIQKYPQKRAYEINRMLGASDARR